MKSFTSLVAAIALLTAGSLCAQAAGKNARENATTAQLNRQQLAMDGSVSQAPAPSGGASQPMPQAGGTMINGKYVPPGARCGNDNPSCAQQIQNPSINSPSQMRLQGAQ
jgi:ABC-type phosphate transport system substrate-binding protein